MRYIRKRGDDPDEQFWFGPFGWCSAVNVLDWFRPEVERYERENRLRVAAWNLFHASSSEKDRYRVIAAVRMSMREDRVAS